MLTIDLAHLKRDGSFLVEGHIDPDSDFFEGCAFILGKPLNVLLTARWAGSGEIVLRGGFIGLVLQDCRRCLQSVKSDVNNEVTMVFTPSDLLENEDDETRSIDLRKNSIDLTPHIRDELILSIPMYIECNSNCKGLCAGCGVNLNSTNCNCSQNNIDSRWDTLIKLRKELV